MFETALESRAEILARVKDQERVVAGARASQIRLLRALLRRNLLPRSDELASLLDVSASTARDLYQAACRTPELSPMMTDLESGEWSFDRAAATAHLRAAGADEAALQDAETRDIAGIDRLRAAQRHISRRTEHEAHEQRSLRSWPSLDSSVGFIGIQLTGADWQLVNTALDDRGDVLPRDIPCTAEQRRADALVALAQDWLDGRISPSVTGHTSAVITVLVDPERAAATAAETGVTIVGGPRVGPETLDEIMCGGAVEILVSRESGVPLAVGPTTRVVPPKVRRFVLARDGGCVVDGCRSRYRLQVHHVVPRSRGGTHDAENLATVCWYHHHVAIHGRGMCIDPVSPPRRRRLIASGRDP